MHQNCIPFWVTDSLDFIFPYNQALDSPTKLYKFVKLQKKQFANVRLFSLGFL